jgi:hypothetical protein
MAGYKLTVDMPNLNKGEVVNISGLGDFKNGSTTEVSEEQANQFRAFHQVYDNEKAAWVPGPTVLQANINGVKVETLKKTTSDSEDAAPVVLSEGEAPVATGTNETKEATS